MNHLVPTIEVLGLTIDLSAIFTITLTCIIVLVIALLATRKLSVTEPSKMQNFMEWVVDFVKGIVSSTMDMKRGRAFIGLAITLIMFIFVGNMLGLPFAIVTGHPEGFSMFGLEVAAKDFATGEYNTDNLAHVLWYKSPTADPAVTLGLALFIIVLANLLGLIKNTKGYLKSFIEPTPLFLPLNLIGEASKLLTLGMRLFGNIFAGEVMISTITMAGAFSVIGLIPWLGFSVFVGSIQAFIFTVLSMVYISQMIGEDEEEVQAKL